jgi:RNA polymerase sigma-70 factor (ECF subfamily)
MSPRRRLSRKQLVKLEDYTLPATTDVEQASRAWYERLYERLIAFAYDRLLDLDRAKDVVQNVMIDLWLQGSAVAFYGQPDRYYFGAVANRVEDDDRRRRRQQARLTRFRDDVVEHTMSRPITADESLERWEVSRVVQAALADMPTRCRETWELRRDNDMSYAQVASKLGLAPATVRQHMMRANGIMRAALARAGYEDDAFLAATRSPMLLPTTAAAEDEGND